MKNRSRYTGKYVKIDPYFAVHIQKTNMESQILSP